MSSFLDTARGTIDKGPMQNVIDADFSTQLIHACLPEDEDQRPICGETPEASFVAEPGSRLRPGFRWCGACLREAGR